MRRTLSRTCSRRDFLKAASATVPAFAAVSATPAAAAPLLAATPPMGWNSYNHFKNQIDDATIRAQADAMVTSGIKAVGYEYVNMDEGWAGERDAQGVIHPNAKFPDMKALADYIHSKELKLGLYSAPSKTTCGGRPGSFGHEEQDAQTYAEWGIDYLKYDLCGLEDPFNKLAETDLPAAHAMMIEAYRKMGDALRRTGRPIVYSLCQYGMDRVWAWGPSVGANLWRTTNDIKDNYTSLSQNGFTQAGLARFAGPGHWNDPDMLEVGNPNFKPVDNFTQMSLWCLLAAPLIAGNDLTNMPPEIQSILCNREVIAVDQDPAGIQGDRVSCEGPLEVWMKPLADGSKAVGLFNRGRSLMNMTLRFVDVGFHGRVQVRDLWEHADRGVFEDSYSTLVLKHGAVLVKVREAA
ncbi:MAG: glycoside hydrolase family 27 protein [Terriglobia bacterium]